MLQRAPGSRLCLLRTMLLAAAVALAGAGGSIAQSLAVPPGTDAAAAAPGVAAPGTITWSEAKPAGGGAMPTPPAGTDAPAPAAPLPADDVAPQLQPLPAAPGPAARGAAAASLLPRDLSPLGMYRAADVVVKAVMLLLLAASVLTWTIFLAKVAELMAAARRCRRTTRVLAAAQTLSAARGAVATHAGPAADMLRAAMDEYTSSLATLAGAGPDGAKERVALLLARIEARATRRLQRGTGILASIGSVAPFVGLFGTVWGIMNAFIGISRSQTTNLAVVAPGIAEALLATAMGLVAAIPAVILYNAFARAGAGQRARLADAAAAVERLVSRDLDAVASRSRQRLAAE